MQKLTPIHAGNFTCDGGALFGVIPKPLWSKVYPADENNAVKLTMRCLLVDQGEHKILIDAGVGNHYTDKIQRNNGHEQTDALPASLAQYGYTPEDITDVVFTHLHWDHSNGAVLNQSGELKLLFPRATHWCSKTQWGHAKISNIREQAAYYPKILRFLKTEGNLQLVEKEGELFSGFQVRLFNGHTPGQMIPLIKSEGKTVVFTGDLIPTAAHVPLLWIAAYDLFPVTAMQEKEEFLKEVAREHYTLFFEHDFYTEYATIEWTEKGPEVGERTASP